MSPTERDDTKKMSAAVNLIPRLPDTKTADAKRRPSEVCLIDIIRDGATRKERHLPTNHTKEEIGREEI